MLHPATEAELERLLDSPLSDRDIARRAGVGRGTVSSIRLGRRPIDLARRRAARGEHRESPQVDRCHGCGRRIALPCRACQAAQAPRRGNPIIEPVEPVGLKLKPEHLRRYLVVRARRALAGH